MQGKPFAGYVWKVMTPRCERQHRALSSRFKQTVSEVVSGSDLGVTSLCNFPEANVTPRGADTGVSNDSFQLMVANPSAETWRYSAECIGSMGVLMRE